jgi:WD40 repeat protein
MSQLIASVSENLQIWEFINENDCKLKSTCDFSNGKPTSLSWNHTNQVVAVGLTDKRIDLVHSETGKILSSVPFTSKEEILEEVKAVKFSGNSRYLASAEGNSVKLWDLKKRTLKAQLPSFKDSVISVSFFADGTIAAGDRGGDLNFCVHYLCHIGWVYVFYVGHVDRTDYIKPFSIQ